MLTQSAKQEILNEFPNIKLSYENIIYNKVSNADYIVAIPEGKKCFAWFTFVQDKPVCLIMELTNDKNIIDIKITNTCFSNELSYGTILYGTLFYISKNKFFTIEDIFSYKGINIDKINWGEKLIKINTILKKDLKQIAYNNSFLIFGIPLICKTNQELEEKTKDITYKIDKIQFKLFNKINVTLFMDYKKYLTSHNVTNDNMSLNNNIIQKPIIPLTNNKSASLSNRNIINSNKPQKNENVFLIRPDIENDIYHLYCLNDELKETICGTAHIPDYNTSVMMNKLFRIIKENENLDALEESDDEEEFENEELDKFVHLDKSYKMLCRFNYKFKKWVPIKLANKEFQIVNIKELNL